MTEPRDDLRDSLRHLADAAEPVDLYERAVDRSRRIARREAAVGGVAALVALGLLTSGLWQLPGDAGETRTPLSSASLPALSLGPLQPKAPAQERPPSTPGHTSTATVAPRHTESRPRITEPTPAPLSRSLADLPGRVFYERTGRQRDVVRLSPGDRSTETVLAGAPSPVGISPDGERIAYAQNGSLLVAPAGAGAAERVADGVSTADQAPVWSPTGDRLLVDAASPAVVDVGSGTVTPLPGALGNGRHFRWSGDGNKLVYATGSCDLEVAASTSAVGTAVPGPACEATSVDATGGRITVALPAAVVDTATGAAVSLPVTGTVVGAVFDPDGDLLVRTVHRGRTQLSLIAPDNTLVVQADEPAALRDLDLLAYTR
nr:hypothetical protein [uncultured Actinoplanes sp.]